MSPDDVDVAADPLQLDEAAGGGGELRVAAVLPGHLHVDETHAAQLRRFVFQSKRRGKAILDVRLKRPLPPLQPLDQLAQSARERGLLRVEIPLVVSLVLGDEIRVFRGGIRAEARAADARELLLEARRHLRGGGRRILVAPVQQRVYHHEQALLGGRREPGAQLREEHLEFGDQV